MVVVALLMVAVALQMAAIALLMVAVALRMATTAMTVAVVVLVNRDDGFVDGGESSLMAAMALLKEVIAWIVEITKKAPLICDGKTFGFTFVTFA